MDKVMWFLALLLANAFVGSQATVTTQANSNWVRNGSFERAWVSWVFGDDAEIV